MANAYIIGQGTGTGAAAPGANASVGLNGAPAPTSSTEIGFIGPGGLEVGVSASNPLPITGTILANNLSVGATGVAAPAFATEIGIIDAAGHLVGSSASNPVRIDPTGTTIQPVSGTITALQGTSPWVVSNAGTFAVQATISGNVTVVQPTGTNLHVFVDNATATAGTLSNNTAAPIADNVGVLPAVANAANPTLTEGFQTLLSQDLSGNLRVKVNAPLPAGTNVIGHVITDTGSTTTVTGTVAVTQSTSPWVVSGTVTITPSGLQNVNVTQWDSVALGAPSAYGTSPGAVNVIGVNAFITNTPAVTVSGTVAVTQSTSPWIVAGGGTAGVPGTAVLTVQGITGGTVIPVTLASTTVTNTVAENLTQVAGVTLGATAVTAYGTAPAAANVPGVNAFITNTPAVTLASTTITGNVTVVQPTGTNLHVVVDSGSALTASVTGTKSNNSVVPGSTNLGVLPGIANAATQTWTEGDQVLESMDLSGRQRFRGTLTSNNAAPVDDGQMALTHRATALVPVYTEGNLVLASCDLSGNTRVIGVKSNNTAAPLSQIGVIPALATAAAPTFTEGFQTLVSVDLAGNLRVKLSAGAATIGAVTGTLTNNNAAPAATEIGVLPALANAANPTWTEGDQVLESVDLSGRQRIMGQNPADTAATGSPVVIAGVDTAGNVQELPVADSNTATLVQVVQVGGAVTTAAPVYTTATSNPLSLDTAGNLRVTPTAIGTLTNNNAAPGSVNVGVLPALANAANPTWTEGNQVLESVDLSGRQRIMGQVATAATLTGSPVTVSGVDAGGLVRTLPVSVIGAAVPLNVLGIGGKDSVSGNATTIITGNSGSISTVSNGGSVGTDAQSNSFVGGLVFGSNSNVALLQVAPSVFNGTTWDRTRSATIGNAVAATGLLISSGYGQYLSTAPAPTTGQYSALQTDYAGSLFTKPIRRSTTKSTQTHIAASVAATSIMPAQAAGIFADISMLVLTVAPIAATAIDFTATLSDGTISYIYNMNTGVTATGTNQSLVLSFNPPLPATTAATAWTITLSTVAVLLFDITAVAVLQKAS